MTGLELLLYFFTTGLATALAFGTAFAFGLGVGFGLAFGAGFLVAGVAFGTMLLVEPFLATLPVAVPPVPDPAEPLAGPPLPAGGTEVPELWLSMVMVSNGLGAETTPV